MSFKRAKVSIKKTRGTPRYIILAKTPNGKSKIIGKANSLQRAKSKAKGFKKTGLVT